MSPIGEPVPRLPPIVARLRMSGDANCGKTWSSSGTRPARRRPISVSESAAPISIEASPIVSSRSSGSRSIAIASARPPAAQVHVDAPVGASGDDHRVGLVAHEPQRLVERCGAHEPGAVGVEPGRGDGAGAGRDAAFCERVGGLGRAEREGGVADRPVARAPAEVAAQRVQVEAVRAVVRIVASVDGVRRVGGIRSTGARRRGRTRPPCCRRSRGCSSRTAIRRPRRGRPARGAAPRACRGPRRSRPPGRRLRRPARGTRSPPSTRCRRARRRVASSTAHAPHSPSAQPSLQPVRPSPRSASSRVVCAAMPGSGRVEPVDRHNDVIHGRTPRLPDSTPRRSPCSGTDAGASARR